MIRKGTRVIWRRHTRFEVHGRVEHTAHLPMRGERVADVLIDGDARLTQIPVRELRRAHG